MLCHVLCYLMSCAAHTRPQAPEEIRNVFRQRSRWTKGHFQVGGREGGRVFAGHIDPSETCGVT
jgi:hypothetical protein